MSHFFVTHAENLNQIGQRYAHHSLIVVILVLALLFIMTTKRRTVESTYLSIDTGNTLKGIAILLLLFGHFAKLCIKGYSFFEYAGDWAVIIFLFISGIALYKTYGISDLDGKFMLNRVRRLAFPTWITLSIFYLLDYMLIHHIYSWKRIVLNYLGIIFPAPPNGPMWFITYIFFLYIVYFFVSRMHGRSLTKVVCLYALCYLCTIILWRNEEFLFLSSFGIWTHYTLVLPTAVLIGVYSDKIKSLLGWLYKHPVLYVSMTALFSFQFFARIGMYKMSHLFSSTTYAQIIHTFAPVPFILSLAMISFFIDKLTFTSKVLNWLGYYSFEIFLLHFPFMVYYDFFLFRKPLPVFFFIYLVFIFLLSFGLNRITHGCNSILFRAH